MNRHTSEIDALKCRRPTGRRPPGDINQVVVVIASENSIEFNKIYEICNIVFCAFNYMCVKKNTCFKNRNNRNVEIISARTVFVRRSLFSKMLPKKLRGEGGCH